MVVDLPAPLGPRKPVTTPGRTVTVKWSTAVLSPYVLVRSLISIIAVSFRGSSERSVAPMR
jgi:hypothetical protein